MGAHCCRDSSPKDTVLKESEIVPIPPTIVRALYDYSAMQDGDLGFHQTDRMIILDDSDPDWPIAQHIKNTSLEGKIPSNYVVRENDNSLEAQDWWFDVDRTEAERLLQFQEAQEGSFLVRPAKKSGIWALSVKGTDQEKPTSKILHYRIKKKENGQVYMQEKNLFWSIIDLVDHYQVNATAGGVLLLKPCPREPEPVPFKDLELPLDSLTFGERLGAGNFGEVFEGLWNQRTRVAIKTLKDGQMEPSLFLDEAKTMHQLRHKKLVQLIGVCTEGEELYIVTELMEKGSLRDVLRKDWGETLNLGAVIAMAAQVSEGMEYMEYKNFIHRDLRSANVLVGRHNICKVADFGMARLLEDDLYASNMDKFPIRWTAPESIDSRVFTIKSDVWSYGVFLYEVVTFAKMPYSSICISNQEVKKMVKKGERLARPRECGKHQVECPEEVYQVMLECWRKEPSQRPSFTHLRKTVSKLAAEGAYDEWELTDCAS